ncbi:hypothetical protein H5S40_04155 [Limosilactobacillus sp. RRLNB_1_1]|uniref:Uncharacterized protein n=1 Tax=Limosilactobacillus albertensis TaxID=2759752 RepID=A0A7W3TRD7_9LACO|nr:hypothetical protein [Limosilactobacillus albertensis]MBB1069348.1 hypothetical protein [Limosilactobacillus albertensis]MCD7128245.1 hypothetical protein [Limosilactobacillus albertensis]
MNLFLLCMLAALIIGPLAFIKNVNYHFWAMIISGTVGVILYVISMYFGSNLDLLTNVVMGLVAGLAMSYILISGTSIKEVSLDFICAILVTLFMTLFPILILDIIFALNSDFVTYSSFTYTLIGVIRFLPSLVGIGFGIYLLVTAKNEQQSRKIVKSNLKVQVLVPSIIIGLTYGASNGFFARHYLKNLLDGFDSFDLDQIEFIMWELTIASAALILIFTFFYKHQQTQNKVPFIFSVVGSLMLIWGIYNVYNYNNEVAVCVSGFAFGLVFMSFMVNLMKYYARTNGTDITNNVISLCAMIISYLLVDNLIQYLSSLLILVSVLAVVNIVICVLVWVFEGKKSASSVFRFEE